MVGRIELLSKEGINIKTGRAAFGFSHTIKVAEGLGDIFFSMGSHQD